MSHCYTLLYIERNWLLIRNLAAAFPLKYKLFVKHIWKLNFSRSKQRTAFRKLFSSPRDKSILRLLNKNFMTNIYMNIQTFAFQMLRKCSSWTHRNRAVQIFFLAPIKNMFAWKFAKLLRSLAVLREHIFYNVEWIEVRKMVRFLKKFVW